MNCWDIYSLFIKIVLSLIWSPIKGAFDPIVVMHLLAGAA